MRNTKLSAIGTIALVLALGVAACQQPAEPEPEAAPAGERIENPAAGVAIAALPPVFELSAVDGDRIVLQLAREGAAGEVVVQPGEPGIGGVNLVAAVERHKQEILARPGGDYKGQNELTAHLGTAFYSRGRYQAEAGGGVEEETAIFLVHPWGDRNLQLIYRYPAGDGDDSRERIEDHLFELLGEIEPLSEELPSDESAPQADDGADAGGGR
jgi:hypothetical protein